MTKGKVLRSDVVLSIVGTYLKDEIRTLRKVHYRNDTVD